jgi:Uma2 family endonuclease
VGVAEYWLVDPDRRQIECYELGDGGRYRLAFAGEHGVHRSHVLPGLWIRAEWFWQERLPKVMDVIRELGVVRSWATVSTMGLDG